MYNVEIYETLNGRSEVKEYILELQKKNSKENRIKLNKVIAYIRTLKEKGLALGEPYIKHIDDEIWELRPLRDRILFASHINNKFILLTVFMKKTQKTPKQEIEKAKRYYFEYQKRSELDEQKV